MTRRVSPAIKADEAGGLSMWGLGSPAGGVSINVRASICRGSRYTQARIGEFPLPCLAAHPPNQLFTRFTNLFTAVIQPSRRHCGNKKVQDYREIDRICKDVVAVRSLAKQLLDLSQADWNDWELDFLQHMVRRRSEPITTRQGEKLLELRDDVEYYSSVHGFGVQSLIDNCWLARDGLKSEENRKFIEQLKETSISCVKRRHLRKLLACARELGEVERYVSIDA
jgi:hypothetical protein